MTIWLIRAGSRSEHEQTFLDEGRVDVAWDGRAVDLGALPDRQSLIGVHEERFPDECCQMLIEASGSNPAHSSRLANSYPPPPAPPNPA
ncbi:MAG: hypothetical protein RLZZ216_376 [Cyanobacteriota bacterium]